MAPTTPARASQPASPGRGSTAANSAVAGDDGACSSVAVILPSRLLAQQTRRSDEQHADEQDQHREGIWALDLGEVGLGEVRHHAHEHPAYKVARHRRHPPVHGARCKGTAALPPAAVATRMTTLGLALRGLTTNRSVNSPKTNPARMPVNAARANGHLGMWTWIHSRKSNPCDVR